MKIKLGIGYDIHRLVVGRKLILGGVEVPHTKGLLGHSDADVLIHAISDSILGALGLPNIGEAFSDTEGWTKDIDSRKILKYAAEKACSAGYEISNIDAVIIAQEPKLSGYLPKMRASLVEILKIKAEDIGLKATTNESLGEIGRGEGIAVIANCLIIAS